MTENKKNFSRRDFIKTAGTTGLASTLAASSVLTLPNGSASAKTPEQRMVPTRPLGKTGQQVSILSLGGVLRSSDQVLFKMAFKLGVTYWDTADSYGWGKNEKAIGKYFAKYPNDRKKVFLVTKAATSDPKKLTEKLDVSLKRMNTSYVDMFFIHYVSDAKNELTNEVKDWAEEAKSNGKIRFFGFSTHKNMEESLFVAADLGWIDAIMLSYNYRLMSMDRMKQAVDVCAKAGIGLVAMKTQAVFSANFYASIGSETDDALGMTEHFVNAGYTVEQAKLKAVWQNPKIASVCSAIPNMTILQANVAAALDKKTVSVDDRQRLEQYAQRTAPGYCAGCARICESAINLDVPVCDILRYSMYNCSYKNREIAVNLFKALTTEVKENILKADYSMAEKLCPQNLPIGNVLKKAYEDLS